MARKIKIIAFLLRASGTTVQHKTIAKTRTNRKVTKEATTKEIQAVVEIGTKSAVHEKVTRIDHDIRFITNVIVDKKDSLTFDDVEYQVKDVEDYTNVSDYYIYLGVKNARV